MIHFRVAYQDSSLPPPPGRGGRPSIRACARAAPPRRGDLDPDLLAVEHHAHHVGEAQRAFYGIVAAVRLDQVHHHDHAIKYLVRVVPRLWLLRCKQRTRIFQNMRVPDIVTAVLLEAGIAARWQLTRPYPQREYTTQCEETDYRFVKRLLAEAGIYFYFPAGPAADPGALTRGR